MTKIFDQCPELMIDPKIGMSFRILLQKGLDAFEDGINRKMREENE